MTPRTARTAMTWLWTVLAALTPAAAVFPQGGATWLAPTNSTVVAECYPFSIEFTNPVPPQKHLIILLLRRERRGRTNGCPHRV
ncbi:hypothetical protein C8F04DRAFT_1165984, partial [Mycena alexandri]